MPLNTSNINHSGVLTGVDNSDGGIAREGLFNLSISGTFVATVAVQRSFDGGVTFQTIEAFTAPIEQTGEASAGIGDVSIIYRVAVTDYTSGTINFRLHQ